MILRADLSESEEAGFEEGWGLPQDAGMPGRGESPETGTLSQETPRAWAALGAHRAQPPLGTVPAPCSGVICHTVLKLSPLGSWVRRLGSFSGPGPGPGAAHPPGSTTTALTTRMGWVRRRGFPLPLPGGQSRSQEWAQ